MSGKTVDLDAQKSSRTCVTSLYAMSSVKMGHHSGTVCSFCLADDARLKKLDLNFIEKFPRVGKITHSAVSRNPVLATVKEGAVSSNHGCPYRSRSTTPWITRS